MTLTLTKEKNNTHIMMSVCSQVQTYMKRILTDAKKMAFVAHTQAYAALV